jgi:hypothetical protein
VQIQTKWRPLLLGWAVTIMQAGVAALVEPFPVDFKLSIYTSLNNKKLIADRKYYYIYDCALKTNQTVRLQPTEDFFLTKIGPVNPYA